jgi:hypothetical protein
MIMGTNFVSMPILFNKYPFSALNLQWLILFYPNFRYIVCVYPNYYFIYSSVHFMVLGTDNTKWELIYRFSTNRTEDPLDVYLSQTMINNDFTESQLLNTSINIHYKTDFVSNWDEFIVLKVELLL